MNRRLYVNRRLFSVCIVDGCETRTRNVRCVLHAWARRARPPDRRPSSAQRGYGWSWQQTRKRILIANGYRCLWPHDAIRCRMPATEVDHVRRKRWGGSDDPGNLMPLCKHHHSRKTGLETGGTWP